MQTEQTPIGTSVNGYVWSIGSLSHTDLTKSTDPYGKPAYKLMHRGDTVQLAEDLREHLKIELHQLNRELYERHSLHPTQTESTDKSMNVEVQPSPKVEAVTSTANVFITEAEKPKVQPIDEKPEIEPRQTNHSNAVQLTLLDLWGMPIEEPAKKKKATKKENKAKRLPSKPKPPITAVPPVESVKPATESKEAKSENAGKQGDPEDIYATLDWETNPPINGFYETMMSLTPERRKALRLEAERHRQEQLKKSGIKDTMNSAFVPSSDNKPEQKEAAKQPEAQPEATPVPITDNSPSEKATASLFPEFETEKAEGGSPRPYAASLSPHAGNAPA